MPTCATFSIPSTTSYRRARGRRGIVFSSPLSQQYSNNPHDLWPHVDSVHYAFVTRGEDGNVVAKDLEGFVAMTLDGV